MRLIKYLKTLKEEMPPQTARNLFLNNIVDPDYESIRKIIKSIKRNAPLAEFLQDIREREDDLERHSSQVRNFEKIRRVSNVKNFPEEKKEEPPLKRAKHSDRLVLPRYLVTNLGTHKGLVHTWLKLSQKGNKSCTEKYIEEES